jgi:hypothetical protein
VADRQGLHAHARLTRSGTPRRSTGVTGGPPRPASIAARAAA